MKNKTLIFTTIIFFILVNTFYYWQVLFGLGAFIPEMALIVVFFGLVMTFFKHFYFAIKEKFKNRDRYNVLIILPIVLLLTFFYPQGIINFEKFEPKDLLIAYREGGGNCTTTIKLKDNGEFKDINICFGREEKIGKYKITNDTIRFDYYNKNMSENDLYEYAIIEKLNKRRKIEYDLIIDSKLILFRKNDTIRYDLFITKNELKTPNS